MVIFGKDVTIQSIQREYSFLSRNVRSGKLTYDILSRLHQWEYGFGQYVEQPWSRGQFPFMDLFPRVGHENITDCMELARDYTAAVKPRVVVTLSRLVSSVAAPNLAHVNGLPRYISPGLIRIDICSGNFLDHVGVPRISYFDALEWTVSEDRQEPAPQTAFIQNCISTRGGTAMKGNPIH